jgi:hypothetical protein
MFKTEQGYAQCRVKNTVFSVIFMYFTNKKKIADKIKILGTLTGVFES